MVLSRERGLVFGALSALLVAVVVAVMGALNSATATSVTSGVAAAKATFLTRTVKLRGATVTVTSKPGGNVCFSAPGVSSCAATRRPEQIAYATSHVGGRTMIAGLAGSKVRAVIARLSRGGAVWVELRQGSFYALLPKGFELRAVVKVLAGGRRVSFPVASSR